MNKVRLSIALLSAALAYGTALTSQAHDSDPYSGDAYWTDTRGNVVRNGYDECWRTGEWTPAKEIWGCGGPAPVKAEPAKPAPAPVAPVPSGPAKPAFEKVMLSAETLFDFDKATLRAEGKSALDDVVNKLQQFPQVEQLQVTAYTDRMGSESYNQKLSQRRADAVKDYLVSKGIAADRIQADGKGESDFVTTDEDCKSAKSRKAKIACYQPDRRAVLEIAVQREVKTQ